MAFCYLQLARRNCWKILQRFGPDLVIFPAASSTYSLSDRLRAVLCRSEEEQHVHFDNTSSS